MPALPPLASATVCASSPARTGRCPPSPPQGFTLPEACATAAILGILAAITGAFFAGTVHASRAADARAALLDTYATAIRHAATRGVHVVACPRTGDGCRDSIDWSDGWLLFDDHDGDRTRGGGEAIVSAWPALAAGVHLRSTVGRKRLVFQPSGGNAGSNVTFTLCDGRGAEDAVRLVVANDGKLRVSGATTAAAAACMAPAP